MRLRRFTTRLDNAAMPLWADYLFAPRYRNAARDRVRLEAADRIVLALYAAILAFAIHQHRNWADEAQAWLIARDCSLHDILLRRLHYEGAPALWPLLLWFTARLHLPYAIVNWIAGAFACAGIYLLLRFTPFPRIFRWLLPCSFFLQYQYAEFARPYALFPLLLFALCALFSQHRPKPVRFALIAGLLANLSFHAAILSGIFSLIYLQNLFELRKRSAERVSPRRLAAAGALFIVLSACAALVAFPAPDVALAEKPDHSFGLFHALQTTFLPEERLPASVPPLDPPLVPPSKDGNTGDLRNAQPTSPQISALSRTVVTTIILVANAACFPIARSNLLAVALLASMALWLRSRGCLRLMLPFWIGLILSVQVFVYDHHTGQFLLALVAATWIALETPRPARKLPWLAPVFTALSLAVIAMQIGWTFHCIRAESLHPFDPGQETAQFLTTQFPGKRIAGFSYDSVSTQAYGPRSLFFNQSDAFWHWSANVLIDRRRTEALLQHPDVVIAGEFTYQKEFIQNQWRTLMPPGRHNPALIEFWQQHGYRITHRFCGDHVMRLGTSSTFCEIILEPAAEPDPTPPGK